MAHPENRDQRDTGDNLGFIEGYIKAKVHLLAIGITRSSQYFTAHLQRAEDGLCGGNDFGVCPEGSQRKPDGEQGSMLIKIVQSMKHPEDSISSSVRLYSSNDLPFTLASKKATSSLLSGS